MCISVLTVPEEQQDMFNVSGTGPSVITLSLAIIQLKVWQARVRMATEGGKGAEEKEGAATEFFNGIFNEGFRSEVISLFMFEWRKS